MPKGSWYVYENWTNTFAKVHQGDCPYCNFGQGFQGRGSKTPSGQWNGPFASQSVALEAAEEAAGSYTNASVWIVGVCGYCC